MKNIDLNKNIIFNFINTDISDQEIEVNYPILNNNNLDKTIDLNKELEYLSIIIREDDYDEFKIS